MILQDIIALTMFFEEEKSKTNYSKHIHTYKINHINVQLKM